MTTPATGAPDWQSFTSLHGAALIDAPFTVNANVLQTLGEFDASSWDAVHISITTSANGGTLTIRSTETASNVADDIVGQWVCRSDTKLSVTVPLPRAKLGIDAQAEPANAWTFNIRAALTNVATDRHHYYGLGSTLLGSNIAIGAGVTQRYFPTSLMPGPAHIWLSNSAPANNMVIRIKLRNPDGTAGDWIAQFLDNVAEFNADFIIPTRLFELDITNNGAGASNIWFDLVTQGMQG